MSGCVLTPAESAARAERRLELHKFVSLLAELTRCGTVISQLAMSVWAALGYPSANALRGIPLSKAERRTCRSLRQNALQTATP